MSPSPRKPAAAIAASSSPDALLPRPVGQIDAPAVSVPVPATAAEDPFDPVDRLGRRASRLGMALGALVAVGSHGAGSARAMSALIEMHDAVGVMRQQLHEFFWAYYDVDVVDEKQEERKEKEPELAPEPAPEPEPAPLPPPKENDDPYEDEPPPAPAEASKVLTAAERPGEPEDLTGEGFVSGEGTGPGYGYVSAAGTAKAPTFDRRAQPGGRDGGRGSKPAPPKSVPQTNRSRPAGLAGGRSWDCPFPAEADVEQIDRATAVIVVTVSRSGRPVSVRILSDPGYGFGRAARQCALGRSYEPALDADGSPVQSTTPPINVRFRR